MGKRITDEEARKIELEILIQFANFCEKNDLRYYLAYGTLIGAIRHKGFIPWDNDVDVVMPRPDYEKFISLVERTKLHANIDAVHYRNARSFPFVKLIDNRTILREHFLVTENCMGIYIDVFPLDGMPDEKVSQEKLYKKSHIGHKMFAFANYRFNTGADFASKLVKNLLYPISRLISSNYVSKKLDTLCRNYNYDDCKYVGNIVWGWDEPEREVVSIDCFDTAYAEFEGHTFRVPKGYDHYLRISYGDYMQLPPEEKRIIHQFDAVWK